MAGYGEKHFRKYWAGTFIFVLIFACFGFKTTLANIGAGIKTGIVVF